MKEQTIYSYRLLSRFHWRLGGYASQIICLFGLLWGLSIIASIPFQELIISLSIIAMLPVLHFLLLLLYGYSASTRLKVTPDSLVSPWWGAGTEFPVSLSFYRGAEMTVCLGGLLVPAALYVWLPISYGTALMTGSVVFILPRLLALFSSIGKPKRTRVKYEMTSISFLLTDG